MRNSKTHIVTGVVRLSYPHVYEPYAIGDGEPKYSVSIIIPKEDEKTVKKIYAAVDAAIEDGKSKFGKKVNTASLKLPLRDGDTEKDDEAYENSYFLNANSKQKPQVVDKNVDPILDEDAIYPGVYARVSLNFYAFSVNGNRGVAVGLGNIQKIKDGPMLGGRTKASDDFDAFGDDNDDFLD